MVLSRDGYSRGVTKEQCVWPKECAPESATRSSALRPLAPKLLMSCWTCMDGEGRLAGMSFRSEATPSRRPPGMANVKPPEIMAESRAA